MFVLEELVHAIRVIKTHTTLVHVGRVEKVHTTLTGCVRDTAVLNGYTMTVVRLDVYRYFQISP